MRRHLVLSLALLFLALGVPSNAQNADVTVDEGQPLTVECALRVEEPADWRLDGGAVPADLRPAGESAAAGRLTARLHAAAARAQHAGEYSCGRRPAQRVRVLVRAARRQQEPTPGTAACRRTVALTAAAPLTVGALVARRRRERRPSGSVLDAPSRRPSLASAEAGALRALGGCEASRRRSLRSTYTYTYTFVVRRLYCHVCDADTTASKASEDKAVESTSAAAGLPLFYYDVGRPLLLNCTLPRPADGGSYLWKKNDTAVENVLDLNKRFEKDEGGAVFRMLGRSNEEDFGNYTCTVGAQTQGWDVRGRPHAKLPRDTNVVENQPLKLVCKVLGKPYGAVTWLYKNDTHNASDVAAALGAERVELRRSEQGVEDGELLVKEAARSDAGVYSCTPVVNGTAAATTLRVKDQYAALWPFLGICAEVFVLCAIILVYEKRRTKPELDDSDTDNHDQKKS
ncbi:immunoglobulin domain-containing protein Bsg [Anticarsia gemmatalis]|uniref:immunoglobulin domain-containing protein Bsg n=1 Tax=Anticarsia gemmatalis TaxID=129554 RepID=UPI003F761EC9